LSVFTGVSLNQGILITGAITAVYCTIGGLWADALTELGQFVIQLLAGVSMFVAVVLKLNDKGIGFLGAWDEPALQGHGKPLVGPYGTVFLLAFLFIKLFEYNGGMLNQAQRYMATRSPHEAERSARLSAALWLIWPTVLFFPMWMSPLLVHAQKPDGSDSYGLMTEQLLPHGLLGLVVVGFFSHTMAMCSSDANAIAAVFTRDVAPVVSAKARAWNDRSGLIAARVTTVVFLGLSMAVATQVNSPTFKDIITIVIKWVAGLMGPIAIPMMLGLLRPFRKSGPTAALTSWAAGLLAFWLVNYPINWEIDGGVPLQYQVSIPLAVSLILYILIGYVKPEDTPERDALIEKINGGGDDDGEAAAVAVPAQAGVEDDVVGRQS
jgi:Na+/proline symporter